MNLLLTYDVDTTSPTGQRRLRRVAKLCEGHGLRVQKSVFEILGEEKTLLKLLHDLDQIIDSDTDSIRLYRLPADGLSHVQVLGIAQIQPHHGDLVL
jgi:CRISPR-associated protein Cas2